MMKKAIQSNEAPAAIGPYSQAIYSGGMVYVSGMLGIDPADGNLKATVTEQAEQALKNLSAVLKEAGTDMGRVVKTTVFITDMGAFGAVNEIYARYFTAPFPAHSCVQVSALPKGGLFEIEATAKV